MKEGPGPIRSSFRVENSVFARDFKPLPKARSHADSFKISHLSMKKVISQKDVNTGGNFENVLT